MSNWISDEDVEEAETTADEWLSQGDFDDHPSPDHTDESQSTGTPLPYLDKELAQELSADGPPQWLGIRWRDIPVEDQPEAWNGLRRWVDWFVEEYRLPTAVVPPCWYRHSDMVAELYAAMSMEYKVWEEQVPTLSPMMFWHTNLQQMIYRLREAGTNAGCASNGQHQEETTLDGRSPYTLAYNETDWNDYVNTTVSRQQLARPVTGTIYYRAGLVDRDGQRIATSKPIGLRNQSQDEAVGIHIQVTSTPNDRAELLALAKNLPESVQVTWESSADGKRWKDLTDHDKTIQ